MDRILEGVCTEFSEVAVELGTALNLPIAFAQGYRHAFVQVNLGGSWYFAEPQSDSCNFFLREPQEEEDLTRLSRLMNDSPRHHGIYSEYVAPPPRSAPASTIER